MTETRYVNRGELTAAEILETIDAGDRIVIELDVLGKTIRMAIRKRGGTYYCDTPVKLLKYDDREAMRTCLERYRLAQPDEETATEATTEQRAAYSD